MRLFPWKTLSLVIDGDDLVGASVSGSALGARVASGPRISQFLKSSPEEAGRVLALGSGAQGRITLTVPSGWCSIRPIALRCDQWTAARSEIMRSLSGLLPLAPTDALVGLIDRHSGRAEGAGAGPGAYLIAIDRARLDPWLAAIRSAIGREVDDVLAPHMAFCGLGLQSVERAEIIEQPVGAGLVCHRLWRGQITDLFASISDGDAAPAVTRLRLTDNASVGGRRIEAHDIAIAAALAPQVAPGAYFPLLGRRAAGERRWALPAAAVALTLLAIWGADRTIDARYLAAAARIERKQESQASAFAEAERDRAATLRLIALLEAAARGPVVESRSMLPDLAAAHAALPTDGFLYRLELDGAGVALRGESKRASEVLQALDATPGFQSARNVSTPAPVEERTSEMFDIRAQRAAASIVGGRQ